MKAIVLIVSVLLSFALVAQEEGENGEEGKEEFEMEHKLSFSSGITFVPKTVSSNGGKEVAFIPTLGLDYNFDFHKYMGIGLVNEFELAKYFIEKEAQFEVEREYAYTGLITFNVFPFRNFAIFVGGGAEFDRHKILPCITGGIEYELEFGKSWFGKMALQYNYLFDYSSIGFQVGFGYAFPCKKK